jgi:hypothetical protein
LLYLLNDAYRNAMSHSHARVSPNTNKNVSFFVSAKVHPEQPLSRIFIFLQWLVQYRTRQKAYLSSVPISLRSVSRGRVPPVALLPHKGLIGNTFSLMKFGDEGFFWKHFDKDQLKTLKGTMPQLAARLYPGRPGSEMYYSSTVLSTVIDLVQ